MWIPTLVATSLNLRIPRGCVASDFKLSGEVALSQLKFKPDIICNYEDMENCDSDEYFQELKPNYTRAAATDDKQGRGVSCWVKKEYSIKKILSMNSPHFMHVQITNSDGIELNLIILRILVSDSGIGDFKDRSVQWQKAMRYVDSLKGLKNIALVGDWNHGVIGDEKCYIGKSRQYFNYQMIKRTLAIRDLEMVSMDGYSFKGFMTIDHLAVSPSISVENARYEDVYGMNVSTIGIPDHSFIVADLRIKEPKWRDGFSLDSPYRAMGCGIL